MLLPLKAFAFAVVFFSLALSTASVLADAPGGNTSNPAAATPAPAAAAAPAQVGTAVPGPAATAAAVPVGGTAPSEGATRTSPVALDNTEIYKESLAALTILFVVAVLLESAFAVIFNWRVFLAYFSRSGVKTIVMIVVSVIVVNGFNLDIVSSLLEAYQSSPQPSGPLSQFITALVLAGGSAGVYNIMRTLGYRSEKPESEVSPKPPADKAWVAIRIKRENAVGDVRVKIRETTDKAADPNAPAPIAGTITFRRQSLGDLLIRRTDRFPQNGGYVLKPDIVYAIAVEGKDASGSPVQALDGEEYVFAPGAIVDFNITL